MTPEIPMHQIDGLPSAKLTPTMSPRIPAEPEVGGAEGVEARPVLLSWTDPEDGETLWVEMWATSEFVDDLIAQGFEVRAIGEDETASSLFVRIRHRGADES